MDALPGGGGVRHLCGAVDDAPGDVGERVAAVFAREGKSAVLDHGGVGIDLWVDVPDVAGGTDRSLWDWERGIADHHGGHCLAYAGFDFLRVRQVVDEWCGRQAWAGESDFPGGLFCVRGGGVDIPDGGAAAYPGAAGEA